MSFGTCHLLFYLCLYPCTGLFVHYKHQLTSQTRTQIKKQRQAFLISDLPVLSRSSSSTALWQPGDEELTIATATQSFQRRLRVVFVPPRKQVCPKPISFTCLPKLACSLSRCLSTCTASLEHCMRIIKVLSTISSSSHSYGSTFSTVT